MACVDKAGAATGLPDIAGRHDRGRAAVLADDVPAQPAADRLRHQGPAPADVPGERRATRRTTRRSSARSSTARTSSRATSRPPTNANRCVDDADADAGRDQGDGPRARRPARAPQSAYTPIVQKMKDDGSNYAQSGVAVRQRSRCARRRSSRARPTRSFIWDCTLQCYDRKLHRAGRRRRRGPVRARSSSCPSRRRTPTRRSPTT